MIKPTVTFVLASIFCSQAFAASSTLDLQAKCSDAAQRYASQLEQEPASVIAHYSKKLDGCYVRLGFFDGHDENHIIKGSVSLINVFEGKLIGTHIFTGSKTISCEVAGQECNNSDDFDKLAKPYLEQ
jgi:hypothetical protein